MKQEKYKKPNQGQSERLKCEFLFESGIFPHHLFHYYTFMHYIIGITYTLKTWEILNQKFLIIQYQDQESLDDSLSRCLVSLEYSFKFVSLFQWKATNRKYFKENDLSFIVYSAEILRIIFQIFGTENIYTKNKEQYKEQKKNKEESINSWWIIVVIIVRDFFFFFNTI